MFNWWKQENQTSESRITVNSDILQQKLRLKIEWKTNQKPCNQFLINLVRLVRAAKYLPSFFLHRPCFFVSRSVLQPQTNTLSYGPRSISIFYNYNHHCHHYHRYHHNNYRYHDRRL